MIRALFLFACVCLLSVDSAAQRKELSFNTTNVISNIFSLSDQADLTDPHSVAFRFLKDGAEGDKTKIIRLKAGLQVLNSLSSNSGIGFQSRTLSDWLVNCRLGFERQKFLSEKFEVYYGWEIGGSYRFSESEVVIDFVPLVNTNNSYGLGTGPYIGFQFHFNERISIYTESNLYFEYVQSEQEFDNFGAVETSSDKAVKLNHFLPNSLYFAISF